jgi:hypothetical protein
VDVGYAKHLRVNQGQGEFVRGTHHVNGIESFWSYAKHRLQTVSWQHPGEVLLALERVRVEVQCEKE